MSKKIAEESEKTKRAREKLAKKLSRLDDQVSKQALLRKSREIHRWIERHASTRVPLKSKAIALFDENQTSATESRKIINLAKSIGSLPLENLLEETLVK